ncbi:RNA-directed DNA polymerase, partial [Tanacetum coccineum]
AKVKGKWSTLGEPSGKWDYYVKYDAPPETTPIEEIAATGWGDEFSDDEVTPGKVTILEERSDWDDDERSGGKVLVIQERLAQNQQEFLDEYLPQWDENLAIQKKESESKWENPFAAKSGENHNHTILHLSKEENDDDDLPYPKFRNFKQMAAKIIKKHEENAFPSSSSQIESTQSYQPPHDAIMGPPVYPPAQQNPPPFYKPDYQFGYPQGKSKIFNGGYGEYHNSQWTLPPAWTESGVMLVLPSDPGLWSEVISRWESITINRLNNQTWSDNKAKLAFVENLLGESEKLMWQQWRTAYPGAYSALEAIADEPQNITSQVRQLILLEDPYRGSTNEQDRAYRDLDRITCEDTKNLWSFLEDFRQLATKSGRLYFPSTTEKLFAKLPPSISKKIEEAFGAKHLGLSSGVLPKIKFTHTFVSEMCKDAALAKELRDLSLCSAILIPDFDDSSVYSISEGEGDTHQSISVMVQDTPIEETVFMAIEDVESDDDLKEEDSPPSHYPFMYHPEPPTKIAEMVQSVRSWKPDKELPVKSKDCEHEWNENTVTNYTICHFCRILTTDMSRLNCPKCQLTTCALCARNYLGKTVNVKRKQPQKQEEEKDFNSNEVKLLKELLKEKTEQVQQMIRDQAKEYYENKAAMQKKEEIWQSKESLLVRDLTDAFKIIDQLRFEKKRLEEQKDEEIRELKSQLQKKKKEVEVQFSREEFPPLRNTHIARPCIETEVHYSGNATTTFGTTAIIDTRASACCINKKVIPKEALEPLTHTIGQQGIVKWKKSKEDPRSSERICAYASGKFSTTQSTIDAEINACINTLEKLKIYYLDKQEVTLRTDCQAIISFYNKTNSNKSSRVRWIKFADAVTGTGIKINIEHIEGKHNTLADSLSRLVNLCFAECTGEMKELAAAALYSVEEVLQSPNAFQKNMKTTCEEVMKISNHFLESSQKLSSHLKNQEHCTNATSSRLIKHQSEWINLMHGDQSPKTLNFQQQKKQLKPCETYKQSYNAKPRYALDNQPKTTTGQINEKMFEFKIKKPEESSSNWKPWHKDWDAITSNHSEDDAIKDDGKYRYNRKGFLEDDESSDDSILIVDPGWDDYCLQALKSNRPVLLFPEARRARM